MTQVELFNPLTGGKTSTGRIIGQYSQSRPGPLLIVLAGIHGNEPSGVLGCDAVIRKLCEQENPFHGRLVAIAGNLPALQQSRRYLDEDLNRIWLAERIESLRGGRSPASSEEQELLEIVDVIEEFRHAEAEKNFFLDCHTTSSASIPYISVPNDAASVQLAGELPVHTVIGPGDELLGVSDRYLIDHGFRGFTFEAGQHHRLNSIEAQEAAIWIMLHRLGCISDDPLHAQEYLSCTLINGRHFYQIDYVHKVTPASRFRMRPGFYNFQRINKEDLLAWEGETPILSRWNARIFLPLYQPSGDDGFSIIHEVEAGD